MTGKPRAAKQKTGTCSECSERVPLVSRSSGNVIGFHTGNRRGIGAGCSGVGYPPVVKS